ncbi:teneurin-m-like isoform X2 [Lineus longissimus]|uniref:teneurin-m-like isoform X2 n=1 Tax=Lineus longissimus TaxID=88925 RepID=UPI00315CBA03
MSTGRVQTQPRMSVRNRRVPEQGYSSSEGEEDPLTHGYDDRVRPDYGPPPHRTTSLHRPPKDPRTLGLTTDESVISPLDTADTPGMRLYSYLSGSEGDIETDHPDRDHWEQGSHSSLSSQQSLSHYSVSDNEMSNHHAIGNVSTLPMPSIPPPPPEDPPPFDQQQHLLNKYPRGNYAETEPLELQRRGDDGTLDHKYYMVQQPTGSGNFIPPAISHRVPMHQSNFPRTVPPKSNNSLPPRAINDPGSPHRGTPTKMMDGRMPDYESLNSLNTQHNNNTHDRHHLPPVHPSIPNASVPVPSYSPVQNDFRNYSKLSNASYRVKKQIKKKCSWKIAVLVLVIIVVIMAACLAFLAASSVLNKGTTPVSDRNRTLVRVFTTGATSYAEDSGYLRLGKTLEKEIPPYSFWRMQMSIHHPDFMKFNFSIPRYAVIGFYGRHNQYPTHLQNDYSAIFDGRKIKDRRKRDTTDAYTAQDNIRNTSYHHFFEVGTWYLALYNDAPDPNKVTMKAGYLDNPDTSCPNNCNGRGECRNDKCYCYPGRAGYDCSQETCPVLCSGNGVYDRGQCKCFKGYKGKECSTKADECEVPNCNGNGECVKGQCVCTAGFRGEDCSKLDCLVPNCSSHGVCMNQTCHCFKGWRGQDCELRDVVNSIAVCAKNCTGHGAYDKKLKKCVCEAGWSGLECDEEICMLDCVNGKCENRRCQCDEAWSGALCDQLTCDKRCYEHGYCDNGTCRCDPGWNGKHCSLDGCPNACNNHGTCQQFQDGWRCSCQSGWKSAACDVAMETTCDDSADNDDDGLTDCIDPDCCVSFACKDSPYCVTSPDPMEILLRKQPPSNTASFFDKMKFLIEDDSVQSYATRSSFNESQVSVIRGKAMAKDGSPLIGVRVSVTSQPLYGFTLTREQGLFDILVNGGGSVTLQFLRQPFKTKAATVTVPWNKLITMDPVIMTLGDEAITAPEPCPDTNHDHYSMRPLVLSTWEHTQLGSCSSKSAIIPESQVLQESLPIPGTDLHLVYHSSETAGYMSTIMIQLTPNKIPDTLAIVYLRIAVQGLTFEKTFEADMGLKYKFAWERLNAYNQKVYGIVSARVSVGYKYDNCMHIFWETQTATMSGYDMPSSDIGGWNLDIHHTYNFQEGILHKGDGTNIYLKEKPKKIITVLGNGRRRKLDCKGCEGPSQDNRLLAPVALASGLDGSLYVGDYNFIRKLASSRQHVMSILEMKTTQVPYKYFMTVSPLDGKLYISDYESRRIIQVKTMGRVRALDGNFEVIAGNGEQCLPGEKEKCGDGGPASAARLMYPKGIAINKDGIAYFADGANIRTVDRVGTIETIIGNQEQPGEWKPMPCHKAVTFEKMTLRWPTALAVNPLDDTVHVLDNDMVLKLTHDKKVIIIAGRAVHCPPRNNQSRLAYLEDDEESSLFATDVVLHSPQHIAFAPNGDLYIVESDQQFINRVRVVTTDGRIYHHVGAKSKCDCKKASCRCFDAKEILASQALLSNPTSITVTPDGVLHISDMGNLRVHSVMSILPKQTPQKMYEVLSPEMQELYIFNRYGQHIQTKNIITDEFMYNYSYSVNSYYGKLTAVQSSGGNKVQIIRDYTTFAKAIKSPNGQVCKLELDNLARLVKFISPDNFTTSFSYLHTIGLLETKHTSTGHTYFYEYDFNGRLSRVIQPTGEVMKILTDVDSAGAVAHISTDGKPDVTLATNGNLLSILHGEARSKISYTSDGSLVVEYPTRMAVTIETSPHPLLSSEYPISIRRKIILPQNLIHRLQWRYYIRREKENKRVKRVKEIGRWMRVKRQSSRNVGANPGEHDMHEVGYNGKVLMLNGENLLTVSFNRLTNTETVFNKAIAEILNIVYNKAGQPINYLPVNYFRAVNMTYNGHGLVTLWQRGELQEKYEYDEKSRLLQKKIGTIGNDVEYRYIYRQGNKPTDVILPSGKQYRFLYDEWSNLHRVMTPSLGHHQFHTLTTIGFHRKIYMAPNSHGLSFIKDYNSNGKLKHIFFPSQMRRVLYTYNDQGKPSQIIFDQSDVTYNYHAGSGSIQSIVLLNRALPYKNILEFVPGSALVKEQKFSIDHQKEKFLSARFSYLYDHSFRVTSLEAQIGTHVYRPINSTYGAENGRLEKVKSFTFQYPQIDKQVIRDINVEITREFDSYGRLKDMRYKFNNFVVYTLQILYDSMNRVSQWRRKIGDRNLKTFEYNYDIDNNVVNILVDGNSKCKYAYDANNNMASVTRNGHAKTLKFNSRDQVETFGQIAYHFDKDGFLIQRGSEVYEYNSFGQLVHARRGNDYEVWYFYDALGRLAARKNEITGHLMQFFYGDATNKRRVTHLYNHSTKEMSMLFYDTNGKLFALERDNTFYYVASDPMWSTVAIFNSMGIVQKIITYSPLGLMESDSNKQFDFPFGFQGGIYDYETNMVFIGKRIYDPTIGRWTAPDLDRLFEVAESAAYDPEKMNFYQFRNPINNHWRERDQYMKDIPSWLALLGYDLNSLIPSVSFSGTIRQDNQISRISDLMPVVSAFECAFERDVIDFARISTVPRSQITPSVQTTPIKSFGPFKTIFGDGVVVSIVESKAVINLLSSASEVSKRLATVLLNDSSALTSYFTINGKDVHYFVKDDLSQAQIDLDDLGISSHIAALENGINITVHEAQSKKRRRSPDIPLTSAIDIRLHGNHTVLNIRYGTTIAKEKHRVFAHAKDRAVEHAWARERQLLQKTMHSVHKWRNIERDQLLNMGKVTGYRGEYIRDIDKYPELADDPQNIVFVPIS